MPRFYRSRFAHGNPYPNILGHCAIIDSLASLQRLRVAKLSIAVSLAVIPTVGQGGPECRGSH